MSTHPAASLQDTWTSVVDEILSLSADPTNGISISPQQRGYLKLTVPLALVEGVALLSVPHVMAKEFVETKLAGVISSVLSRKMGRAFGLAVTVDESLQAPTPTVEPTPQPVIQPSPTYVTETPKQPWEYNYAEYPQHVHQQAVVDTTAVVDVASAASQPQVVPAPTAKREREVPAQPATTGTSLNPKYTFDTYVVSTFNNFSASAGIAVAEQQPENYNPLFIWGGSGLGKTHLLHAIGNYALQLNPKMKIKYVSSEEFTNDYINSVRDDRQESFKRRYRNLDLLMIDDIQFLQGKESTQEEFFHTFNTLKQNGGHIILSSDRPPKELTTLEDRLRTRFTEGLMTDINPPDLETRIAILSKKAQTDGIDMPHDVMELIASRVSSSIRELEGYFIRVSAFASLSSRPIDLSIAKETLADVLPESETAEITPNAIIKVTTEYYQITVDQMMSTAKSRPVSHPRQMAMYLCRELTGLSLPKIGEHFGGKDHTTVIYACRKIQKEITENQDTYKEMQALTSLIKNHNQS